MRIELNGEPRTLTGGSTVAELLKELQVQTDRVAVEINLQILDRKAFGERVLQDGDRVEVISFMGGGAIRSVNGG